MNNDFDPCDDLIKLVIAFNGASDPRAAIFAEIKRLWGIEINSECLPPVDMIMNHAEGLLRDAENYARQRITQGDKNGDYFAYIVGLAKLDKELDKEKSPSGILTVIRTALACAIVEKNSYFVERLNALRETMPRAPYLGYA